MAYWRIVENFHDFQCPVELGERWLAVDMIQPDFEIDTRKLKFRFRTKKEDASPIGDFCYWNRGCFFVSARAYEAMADLFARHGRGFPVKCGKYRYYIVTVDNAVDALDYDRSVIDRLNANDDIRHDIYVLRKIAIKKEFKTDLEIFRLVGDPIVAFEKLVSDKFKDAYEEAGLTGLLFRDVIQ